MIKILIIDNYDSFVYNLLQYLGEVLIDNFGLTPVQALEQMVVLRNNAITLESALAVQPTHIVISPGPCTPKEAGISVELVKKCPPATPLLGVCLGHQAIGAAFGGAIEQAPELMHGKTSTIEHTGHYLYDNVPKQFTATRYHSLVVSEKNFPPELVVNARTPQGLLMGVHHRSRPIYGVQFHPESIASEAGHKILYNFLKPRSKP